MSTNGLLSPVAEVDAPHIQAPRLKGLQGKVVAIVDNEMPGSGPLLERLHQRLAERFKLAGAEVIKRFATTANPNLLESIIADASKKVDFAITGLGSWGSCTTWCIHAAVAFEKHGVPTVTFLAKGFDALGRQEAKSFGVSNIAIIGIPPEARRIKEVAEKVADEKVDEVVQALTLSLAQGKPPTEDYAANALAEIERNLRRPKYVASLDPVCVPATVEEATPAFYRNGWTDGLPIIPPTRKAVDRMLAYTDWAPEEIVGKMPPKWGKATVEKIAVNAVMAGCLPEHMPILVAAAQIMCDPAWDLYSTQASTNPGAPLLIVNGPIAKELDINCGFNIFGQGWQANATIGRAIRLMMMNIGGGLPGITDKATHGQPAKYTFCIAENEEDSPWEPLHVEKGYAREVSAITMYGAQAIHPAIVLDNTAESCLILTADAMCMMGTDTMYYAGIPMVILNPRLAGVLAAEGYSKADVKKWLFEHARVPVSKFPPTSVQYLKMRRSQYDYSRPDSLIPAIDRPEDLEIVVSGAHGSWSVFLPNHAKHTPPRTAPLALKDGTPVKSIKEFKR